MEATGISWCQCCPEMKGAVVLVLAGCLAGCLAQDRVEIGKNDVAQERLIALYSTFSLTRVSTTTTMVTYSCHVTPGTATACKRRRRKRSARANVANTQLAAPDMTVPEITSSKEMATGDTSEKDAKLFFTIWTTSYTTVTVTSSSTNFSTTASIELSCTIAGQSLLPNC